MKHINLRLFSSFFKIGAFTFGGGWAMISLLEEDIVNKHKWLEKEEFIDNLAIAQSLPGIMVANITLLFGYQLAGVAGGVACAIGLCLPAVVVLTAVTAIYDLIKSNYWVFAALRGVQCAVVPIIGSAAISLSKEALKDKIAIGLCLAALCICLFTSISNLVLVIGGAVLGLVWMGVKEHD